MRCLYCGKELALLKRWTSGGEFCSEAHRQQYQEEYNQLALKRLLQAKPAVETKPPVEAKTQPMPAKTAPAPAPQPPTPAAKFVPAPPPEPEVKAPAVKQEAPRAEEEPVPSEGGFFLELPVPVMAGVAETVVAEAEFERCHAPVLPVWEDGTGERWVTELVAAGRVAIAPSCRVMDYGARLSEGKLELREFVRAAPVVEFDLRTAGATEIAETSEEPMDILIFPQPPPAESSLWQAAPEEFSFNVELGTLTRVAFRTTGIDDNESGEASVTAGPAEQATPVEPPAETPVEEPAAPRAIPVRVINEPARPAAPVVVKTASPAMPSFFRTASRPAVQMAPAAEAKPAPEPATKPLPVTLHGLAAGRGKPVQVFATAVSGGMDVQVPRSSALPLRPVMLLAPARESKEGKEERKPERSIVVKTDVRRQQQRPDTRFSNGKGRQEPEKAEPERSAAVATAVKEPEPPVQAPQPPKENVPAPLSRPFTSADLDLPSLTLDAGGSFWSKLPIAGKAGAGLVAALAIGAAVFALSHTGAKPVTAAPRIVEGPALTAVDSGWITDWGVEPGVRRERDISVLRPSLNMTDYRVQFEAQIESKALGWVYRARDDKNYYVNKLEIVKSGLEPTIALVRFAVIDGQEQPRAQFPLAMAAHLDTLFKVRFDAVGDRFSTYVQDQKVDEWTDERLKMGGIGLYSERGERMSLKGSVNVVSLVIQK